MVARKSRKNIVESNTVSDNTFRAAGYIRLSVVKENQPSDSIENQKKIIEAFLKTKLDIDYQDFYIDENASGTTFERKAFQAMLSDIEKGIINCVVVKDLSRLGRDFIETGYYVEQYFPTRRVRFVSINDRFDTIDGLTDISFEKQAGIRIPITNLFNQKVADDIRAKTQASIDTNIHSGKSVAPRAPYGYKKSLDDCHLLIPDPEAAAVVQNIFDMVAKGVGLNEIVRRLNSSETPSPIDYARANGLQGNYEQGNGLWNTRTVKYILTNRTYTGDLVQGKDQYAVENTHVSLVSREVFNAVQESFSSSTNSHNKTNISCEDNILKGKVICGSCGGKMQRRKGSGKGDWNFFTCITNNRQGAGHCTGMYIRESAIMETLRSEVGRYTEANKNNALTYEIKKIELDVEAAALRADIQAHRGKDRERYENFVQGITSPEVLKHAHKTIEALQAELQEVETQVVLINKNQVQYQLFCDALGDKLRLGELIRTHLEKVIVHGDKCVGIRFE